MSNSRICEDAEIDQSILSEKVTVGQRAKIGLGENIANEYKPQIYNSGITVIGEEASIPADAVIGKNVMIDIGASAADFTALNIESGKSVFKGGVAE
jgi:glucose-1-phosphate adenylyltransferase